MNMTAMQQPEAFIGGASDMFDAQGELMNESTRDFFGEVRERFRRMDREESEALANGKFYEKFRAGN
jgi:hypothetical protein